jgi:hypothetical protein
MGAGPDDDYHLVSVWCATGDSSDCRPGTTAETREVPEAVVKSSCFSFDADKSAACQDLYDFDEPQYVETNRGNFVGAYPPVYYLAMSVFVSDDILASAMIMRLANVLLFVVLATVLYALLAPTRRPTLVWGWVITTVPLGLFLIASNNPSGWAVTGMGTAWLALLGYFESTGRRQWGLGAIFAVGVIMAAGSRGDAAMYTVGAMVLVTILAFARTKEFLLKSILPVVMAGIALAFFFTSRQSSSGLSGFGGAAGTAPGSDSPAAVLDGVGLLAYNVLNVPSLWAGVFGGWGLGWLDTPMPAIVLISCLAAFFAVGFAGLSRLSGRKLFVIVAVAFVLWALPTYVLTAGGDIVGSAVQPRYILPLIVLLGGLLVLQVKNRPVELHRAQVFVIVAALVGANFVAMHMNIRRYVTGNDEPGWNLDAGLEWFWDAPFSPSFVWIAGSAAFAGLLVVLVKELKRSAGNPQRETVRSA